ncbi:hypothetical protein [Streptomyces sp. LBL]|uniref:hypothetical protein n=1 Tax=Streptomyces sp. LBL TaxID=2940562 RepID=UPI0032AEEC08
MVVAENAQVVAGGEGLEGACAHGQLLKPLQVLLELALGRAIAVLPRSLARPQHPGLVHVPVADAPRSALVLAWGQEDRRRLVADFVASAVEAAPG